MKTILSRKFNLTIGAIAIGIVLLAVLPKPAPALDIIQGVEAFYITFQLPGGALPTSLSGSLSITGIAFLGEPTGFVRNALGKVTTFSTPLQPCVRTYALSINVEGAITGYCQAGAVGSQGFVRSPQGAITMFDCLGTSINVFGTIAGPCGGNQGFMRSRQGTITKFDLPGKKTKKAPASRKSK